MKKITLWIGGIVLLVIAVAAAYVFAQSFWSEGSQMDGIRGDAFMPPANEERMLAQAPMPTSAVSRDESDYSSNKSGTERIVIRSARLAVVSKDVEQAAEALKGYAQENGGFVVNANVESNEDMPPTAQVSLRIPADKLDAAVAFVRKQAVRVASESVSGEDVTEEYVDLEAKLKNLNASETQLLSIMKDARKTEDVLSVRREIERVRGEIDSLTGRKKYLDQSAKMSSVFVSIATDEASLPVVKTEDQWRPVIVMKQAASTLLDVLKFLVNVVIWAIVFVPVWGTAILVVRYWKRRRL